MTEPRTASCWIATLLALWLTPCLVSAQPSPTVDDDVPAAATAEAADAPDAGAVEQVAPPAVDEPAAEPERLTDRVTALRQAKQESDALLESARQDPEVAQLLEHWATLADPSQALAEDLDRARAAGAPSDILRDHVTAAERRRGEIGEWLQTLQHEVERLDDAAAQAARLLDTWRPRSQRAAGPDWAELAGLVDVLLARLEGVPAELQRRHDEVATHMASLGQIDQRLEQAIVAAREQRDRDPGWFRLDASSLSDAAVGNLDDMRARAVGRWDLNKDVLVAYLARHPAPYVVQLALWLASTLLLVRSDRRRRRGAVESTDAVLDAAVAQTQRHPVSAGFLLSMGVSILLHDDAPPLHHAILDTCAVFATVALTRGSRAIEPGTVLSVLMLLVVADWVRALALGPIGVGRLVMDVELLVLVLLYIGRTARPAPGIPSYFGYRRWLPTVYRAVRAVAVMALVADLVGLSLIGRVLGRGALQGTYYLIESLGAYWALLGTASALCHEPAVRVVRSLQARRTLVLPFLSDLAHKVFPLVWVWIAGVAFDVDQSLAAAVGWLWNAGLAVGDVDISVGDILTFAFVVWASLFTSRLLRAVLEDDVMTRTRLPSGVPYAISTTTHYVVIMFGGFLALSAAGIDMTRFTVLAGAFGVGIGFGMQNIVNNFVSGLILLYERPIKVGDTIEVESLQGEVKRIGIRSSTVRTFNGAEVLVPNATLVSTNVINFTLDDRSRRIELPIGVAYGTDPSAVLELLRQLPNGHAQVLTNPAPQALFLGFGASSLDFELRVWVADFGDGMSVRSDLGVALDAALTKAGIEVPFPQSDLHIRSVADGIVPKPS